ncbi:MAG: methyltransferase domain-containing protein, partial [Candidatus Nanopelagicales bacterium]
MDKDQARAYWDVQAEGFDDEVDHGLTTTAARSAWWAVMRDKLPEAPACVADLGCGTGSLSVLLASRGYEVLGIDLSPEMIRRARQKAAVQGLSIDFSVGDACKPPLDPQSQDVVL